MKVIISMLYSRDHNGPTYVTQGQPQVMMGIPKQVFRLTHQQVILKMFTTRILMI